MKISRKLAACAILAFGLLGAAFAKESPNITVFRPAVNPRNKKDVMVKAAAKYTKETGGKVTFVLGDWGGWQTKVLSNMAAGTPIDVIFAGDQRFPMCYLKGYLQPIDDYVDMNFDYINKYAMENCFKFDGHYYLCSQETSSHYWIVIYNKSLMEEEGIKEEDQPYALWQAGKWDWAHLEALARKLTKDTSGSGEIDRWGFGTWWTRGFAYMNGATFCNIDEHGNGTLNFDDPRIMEALTFLESAKKAGWYQQDNSICQEGIQNRTLAMYMEREYYPHQILSKTDDEICYVPLPVGPSGDPNKHLFECDGYGIGAGSQNPTYAGKYIRYALEEWHNYDLDLLDKNPPEINELTKITKQNPWYTAATANPIDTVIDDLLGEIVWGGNSPASAIEKTKPKAIAYLQDANKPMGKLEKLPFKAISENFDKMKKTDAFPVWNPNGDSQITVELDKKGIAKTSLKINTDYERDGADIVATVSNPDKLCVVGWRDYQIELDVKALEAPAEDGYVFVDAYASDVSSWGWTRVSPPADGSVVHLKGKIINIYQNGKIGIRIGAHNMKSFEIDNLTITELED